MLLRPLSSAGAGLFPGFGMSGSDGALVSRLDELQSRLSRVASLSTPVDVDVSSARSTQAPREFSNAVGKPMHDAHTPLHTPLLTSPSLEGRAAYFLNHDVAPYSKGKQKRSTVNMNEKHKTWSKVAMSESNLNTFSEPHKITPAPRKLNDAYVFKESPTVAVLSNGYHDNNYKSSRLPQSPHEKTLNASITELTELDKTRARLIESKTRETAALRRVEILQSKLTDADEREAKMARKVASVVADAERIVRMARRGLTEQGKGKEKDGDIDDVNDVNLDDNPSSNQSRRAASVRVSVAEATGELNRLASSFGIPKAETYNLFRKLKEIAVGVAEIAAVTMEETT